MKSRIALAALLLLSAAASLAQTPDLETRLQSEYRGKTVFLRGLWQGKKLRFDRAGKLIGSAKAGSWTTAGEINIDKLSISEDEIRIEGTRHFLILNRSTNSLEDVLAPYRTKPPNDDPMAHLWDKREVQISIALEAAAAQDNAEGALKNVFAGKQELGDVVPGLWQWFVRTRMEGKPRDAAAKLEGVYRVGGPVTPPRGEHMPDPEYAEEARTARIEGVCVFWVLVGADGTVRDLHVVQPMGLGLDDKAAETIRKWRFKPATLNGKPVSVQINVEVNFHLY